MSRLCDLIKSSRLSGNSIAMERSRITRRTKRVFNLNLQMHDFELDGQKVRLKVSNRTLRTIEKFGGLKNCCLSLKRGQLTELGNELRKKILNKMEKEGIVYKFGEKAEVAKAI